jgi:hypothetical protein
MDNLSDFKPLSNVTVRGVGALPCTGLTLVVGPNSSGKTQLLIDLYRCLCGQPRTLVVASDIRINKPEYEPFIKCLESEGYIRRFTDTNNQTQLIPQTTYAGSAEQPQAIQPQQAHNWYTNYDSVSDRLKHNQFLSYFGRFLVTALFLERRLTALGAVALIDFENQPPQHDLHVLQNNDVARRQLATEISESFGKGIWPDMTRGNAPLCLRVCDGSAPGAEDRHSRAKMSKYRTIETEGDGLKSYAAICIALLLGYRPVCLIDEPEMCLHPPQAYRLGRFIGRYGSSKTTTTFVATHSSEILRGVVQSTSEVEIIRLTQRNGEFIGRRVPAHELVSALEKPTLRAEAVLDGIFAESVIVLEADGDRLVYHAAWDTLSREVRLDVHFAAVGGIGGIADTCKLYRTLNIPVAVIADLDMIADIPKLTRLLDVMSNQQQSVELIKEAKNIKDGLRARVPTIQPADVTKRVSEIIADIPGSWDGHGEIRIRRELGRLCRELDRLKRLKGGLSTLPANVSAPAAHLIEALKGVGVFLVPVGELEGWLSSETIGESRHNKAAWANAAALRIQKKGACQGDVWDFLREVAAYLRGE